MKQDTETNPNREKWNDFYRKEINSDILIPEKNHLCREHMIPDKLPQNMKIDSSEKTYEPDICTRQKFITRCFYRVCPNKKTAAVLQGLTQIGGAERFKNKLKQILTDSKSSGQGHCGNQPILS